MYFEIQVIFGDGFNVGGEDRRGINEQVFWPEQLEE